MKIKISDSVVCIPPHISTTWDHVTFIQSEKEDLGERWTLIFHLADGKVVKAPHLDASLVDIAFNAHMKYLETSGSQKEQVKSPTGMLQNLTGLSPEQMGGAIPLQFNLPGGLGGMENAMQHNSAQSDSPPVPNEILEKISGIVKLMTGGDTAAFPKPEPHCNCMHCQIARALHGKAKQEEENSEEEEAVTEEDLQFRTWDIAPAGDKLYTVTNPLDPNEQYSVYLGSPVGCTCGKEHCEHIGAVLSS